MSDGPIVLPEIKVEAEAPPVDPIGDPPRTNPKSGADDVSITVGNATLSGWQSVQVTRSLLSVPSSFDLAVTERYPSTPDLVVEPGAECVVKIGEDIVLTGYVDRYTQVLTPQAHQVRISGRSRSEDLVDCSAIMEIGKVGGQAIDGTALSIAQRLAKPYNVTIESIAGPGKTIPTFVIILGETVWEIIDRVTRVSAMVAYDMPDGSVRLADVGSEKMASGFTLGENVESVEVLFSMDQRYQEYEAHMLSTLTYGTDAGVNSPGIGEVVKDDKVPRFRKKYVISEQVDLDGPLALRRATWERNRRFGMSQMFSVTCDSWRDSAGALWAPNHLAPIRAEPLKLTTNDWCIAEVSYVRDEGGQHSRIVMMPPVAFTPEPTVLQNYILTVEAMEQNNPTKPQPGGPSP